MLKKIRSFRRSHARKHLPFVSTMLENHFSQKYPARKSQPRQYVEAASVAPSLIEAAFGQSVPNVLESSWPVFADCRGNCCDDCVLCQCARIQILPARADGHCRVYGMQSSLDRSSESLPHLLENPVCQKIPADRLRLTNRPGIC